MRIMFRTTGTLLMCLFFMCSYGQESFTLRIMHNNDGESKLLPTDVDGRTIGGASAFKTAVESLRAEDLPSVMLSSGDNFLAGIAFDANNDDTRAEEPLFDALVLDALAYDAICIGNHDLDFGPDVLADLIEDFETTMPPYLSANLDFAAEGNLQALVETGRIAANTVIELGGESIGVFALTTDNLASITSVGDIVVNTDIVGVAQAQIAELEGQGINKIIMISHLQGIQEEIALAAQLSGVDVIIAGGGDELLTNDATIALPGQDVFGAYPFEVTDAAENTTYIVTTPGEYNYLGNLIVEFDAEGNVSSIDDSSNPILIEGFETDANIDSTVIQPLLDIISDVTALATTEVDLDGTRGSIRSVETNQGNLIADAFVHAAETATIDGIDPELPIVALTNGGGIRNNNIIRANSTITDQTTQSMLPFGNTVVVLNAVTPIQFKTILENSVAAIGNGEGTGRFGQIGGFSFEYDPAQPNSTFNDEGTVLLTEGSRIISATLADGTVMIADGEVNADAPSVYIVTNNFIAAGRDGYTTFGEVGTLADLGVDYKVALDNYLVGPLAGVVTADAYPEGGEGRITTGEIMTGLNTFTLRLLHNNDGESKLVPQDVDGRLIGGAAEFKTLLDATRTASDDATIFLSSGDNILPGLSFDANEDPSRDGLPLFDATVLDALDYDAICLGNHDFDAGPEVLAQLISDQTNNMAPYLSANLDFSGEAALQPLAAAGRIVPSVVLDVEGEAVGVIGLTTRDLANISSPGDVMINDVLPAAQEQIAIMTESGINKIIVISHLQGIDQEISLAGMLTDVDVIIAGGGSELYTNDSANELPTLNITAAGSYPLEVDDANGNTTYIVTTPGEYRYLGSLTMEFDADGNIVTIGEDSDVILVADETPDADLAETVIAPFEEIIANLTEVLATTEVELDGTRTSIRTMETNVGNLISDAFLFATATNATLPEDLPVVALTNGGGIRNSVVIPAGGDITRVETGMMLPFGNGVEVLGPATPADLKSLLENGLRSAPESTGRFSQVGGMTIVYDPNGTPQQNDDDNTMIVTPGTKVVSVTLEDGTAIIIDGEPVADAPSVYVVTNDFIGGGRDGYVTFASLETVATVGDDYKTVLEEYLVNGLSGVVTAAEYPEGGEGRITATMDMGGDAFTLRVMHNNDGESRLLPSSIDGRSIGGAAAFKTVVDELRAMDTPSIMLSSGDNFLAGVAFDANNDESRDGLPLFDALVLDAIGYDAICIGNHDLDFGPDVLAELINDFQNTAPPYLSANLDFSAEPNLQALVDDGRIAANTILEVNGEQIGVFGLTTDNLASITSTGDIVIDTDILGVAQAQIAELQEAGINKIIMISHLQGIQEEIALAGQLTGVDIIIAGGGDELLSNDPAISLPGQEIFGAYPFEVIDADGATTYIVTTPGEYNYVGNLIVDFDDDGVITAIGEESNPILVEGVVEDAGLLETVIAPLTEITSQVTELAITEVDLDGTRTSIRSVETNEGNLIADAFVHAAETAMIEGIDPELPIVALTNGGGIRNNNIIRANSVITTQTTQSMLPFGNTVVVLNPITPTQFKTVLENAIAAIGNGEGTGRFGQISGFEFVYDPAQPRSTFDADGRTLISEGSRIISAQLADGTPMIVDGAVVEDAPNVYFVTNNFIAGEQGRDGYTTFGEVGTFVDLGVDYKVALENFLVGPLEGVVTAEAYPEGGEGRITTGVLLPTGIADGGMYSLVGTYASGIFDDSGTEIVAHDPTSQRLFFTDGANNAIGVLDIADPANPTLINTIDMAPYGDGVNSVAVANGFVAVASEAEETDANGQVVFFNTDGEFLNSVEAGALPDMVTFTNDGSMVITANEGEPNDEYTIDPVGSVTVIDISTGPGNATATTIDFTSFDADAETLIASGVRVFGPGATLSQDLEPEYIAVTPDDAFAYVVCQENNAMAKLDLATLEFVEIAALGLKDHSLVGNGIDASNRTDDINITTWPVFGMYQPDAIHAFTAGDGNTYVITANEGDARDYDGFSEEVRVNDLTLDPTAYPNAAELQTNETLGRLRVTDATGDTDGDGDIDIIHSYGARSFTIWDADCNLVWDSGDEFGQLIAATADAVFNSNNDDNDSRKSRSDDKGVEPEAVEIVTMEDRVLALIGLERQGGIMTYDVTDPTAPLFVDYFNNRNFNAPAESPEALDLGLEDIKYISPENSPNGNALVVTANEVSGTISIFGFQGDMMMTCDVDGGDIVTVENETSVDLCNGDAVVTPTFFTTSLSDYIFLVTDEDNVVLAFNDRTETEEIDLSDFADGTYRIWGYSTNGSVSPVVGESALNLIGEDICGDLSGNFITVNISSTGICAPQNELCPTPANFIARESGNRFRLRWSRSAEALFYLLEVTLENGRVVTVPVRSNRIFLNAFGNQRLEVNVRAICANGEESNRTETIVLNGESNFKSNLKTIGVPFEISEEFDVNEVSVYPNPISDIMTYDIDLVTPSDVQVTMRDITGRTMTVLAKQGLSAGAHKFSYDATSLSAGMYIMEVKINDQFSQEMITKQ